MSSILYDAQQIVMLDTMESILKLIPLVKELEKDPNIPLDRTLPSNLSSFYGKMVETKRNISMFYTTMKTILENQMIPNIRSTIGTVLPLRDNDATPFAIENFMSDGSYSIRSNNKIKKYNERLGESIAIEANYLIDCSEECWYDVIIEQGEIKIEKLDGAAISLQSVIDSRLGYMLDAAESLLMFIDIEYKLHNGKYFSNESLERISNVLHEKIMPSALISTIPNPLYLTEMYENIVKINSAMIAFSHNITITSILISEHKSKYNEYSL